MASVSLNNPIQAICTETAFYDQNCQILRVVANTIVGLCLGLFYKISSLFLFVFTANISHQHNSLSNYHFARAFSQPLALFTHGSRVIDFSMNTAQRPKAISGANELDELRETYGSWNIDHWGGVGSDEIPLKGDLLTRLEMAEDECSLGISLDFISRYLTELQSGKAPKEAVKAVAPLYSAGTTKQAELAQIFYRALDSSTCLEDFIQQVKSALEEEAAITQNWFLTEQAAISAISHQISGDELTEKVDSLKEEFETRMQELEKKVPAQILSCQAIISYKRHQMIAHKVGISLELKGIIGMKENSPVEIVSDFQYFVDALPEGIYQIELSSEKSARSLVFIKTDEENFLHDPNLATLVLTNEEAAQEIWRTRKELSLKEGLCSMSFSLAKKIDSNLVEGTP